MSWNDLKNIIEFAADICTVVGLPIAIFGGAKKINKLINLNQQNNVKIDKVENFSVSNNYEKYESKK